MGFYLFLPQFCHSEKFTIGNENGAQITAKKQAVSVDHITALEAKRL
jgi:hypothetical protein